jgi:hypothetical protein
VKKMKAQVEYQLQFARDRHANDLKAAETARLVARADNPSAWQPFRRAVGRSLMTLGARVAAEASVQPARSR